MLTRKHLWSKKMSQPPKQFATLKKWFALTFVHPYSYTINRSIYEKSTRFKAVSGPLFEVFKLFLWRYQIVNRKKVWILKIGLIIIDWQLILQQKIKHNFRTVVATGPQGGPPTAFLQKCWIQMSLSLLNRNVSLK